MMLLLEQFGNVSLTVASYLTSSAWMELGSFGINKGESIDLNCLRTSD